MTKIAMLSTGEEVLHGDIVDTNAAWMSAEFYQHGFALAKRSTVGDQMNALVEELLMLSFNYDVVIVNGGLGPTTDDMSAAAAATASEQKLVMFPEWLARMEEMFSGRGMPMPDSNLKQALLPASSEIVDNPVGTACGFKLKINDATFYFTPGVPSEFKRMVTFEILPDLSRTYPQVVASECSRLFTFGLSESGISDVLDQLKLPEGYELGYRSYLPFIEVKLFGPKSGLETRVKLMQMVYKLLESNVVSVDEPMIDHIGHIMAEKKKTLSVSEVSTKGALSAWLQLNEQVEDCFGHSWVMAEPKESELEKSDLLAATFALAGATREKCGTELALVTGKLEGNTFSVALSTEAGEWGQVLEFYRQYSREDQRNVIKTVAADMLRRHLDNKPMFGTYSSVKRLKDMFIPATIIK
ncbi:CinA family nicotinamide mononucleotide deamidase-related protein [Vibrio cyclitrophicus]|uniref:CinA family nicotinamide mononucleotide deamidase-related protein n=1 Tax=Vibrio cyclitrophicus TaxID=47951 RepID=UPI00031D71D8|nr:CinA family nicotinamide mononucleotide deamidase-related protein [Vibrio cyclitrophicus]OED60474.1 competence/damage-inducible protein A [Vibrio cyclitrophicus ZF99]PME44496.1 competence/damage-inducible protein A [Vibrio cyclitrophicus]PME51863.1 competence/damage-inducible protein A [Vibrio cyclitrophicus]PME72158.1 competence/damage-inducible protein A [Vibrio cyclitrophicus]PMF40128.1 competence/damage-inducible protein A [Vibrio cyclitrophicus]